MADNGIDLELAVCGSHLSEEFGETIQEIEADARPIGFRFETVVPGKDTTARSLALATSGFAEVISRFRPDLVFLPGDRYEILAAASAALVSRVPVAHYAGGQLTEGAWDDPIRHAVTKLSHLHFTATEPYRQRIIQMGEDPCRVFVSGSLGLDNILSVEYWPREKLERDLNFNFGTRSALVTFHPATLETELPEQQIAELLAALDNFPDLRLLFTQPNVDEGGRAIGQAIQKYIMARSERAMLVPSLGRTRYLSALRVVDMVIGNSSSGIIEAPSFGIATVNIGDRQQGRIRSASIIDCLSRREAIVDAINKALDREFRATLTGTANPYGDGHAASRIHAVLRDFPLENLIRKHFYDMNRN